MTVMEMELALAISKRVASSPITSNVETVSKVNVPGPLAEKSYKADTPKELNSTEVAIAVFSLRAYPRALQSHSRPRR